MADLLIPIVFPDYKITIETPATKVHIPDIIPFVDILPNEIRVPHTKNKISDLGHAGVLFINGKNGSTKYYEYGRYDAKQLGWVRKIQNLPNVKLDPNKDINEDSLKIALKYISTKAGKKGRISAAFIKVENKYELMLKYAQTRMALNRVPGREKYSVTSYSCVHFMKGVMDAAGIDTPWMLDPRPVSYIEEVQDDYPSLEYDPKGNKLKITETESLFGF